MVSSPIRRVNPFMRISILLLWMLSVLLVSSCSDDYIYNKSEPEWLGASIYDYLKEDGSFKIVVKLINDLDYTEVLGRTGSKTLFVANDSAYNEFFKNNAWGVGSYDELSLSQKKLLLKYATLNNPYTLSKLSNYNSSGTLIEGLAMRQETEYVPIDSVAFSTGDQLPTSPFWDYYRDKGVYEVKDNTKKPIVYFTKDFVDKYSLTEEDFALISGGKTRSASDFYVFNNKVIQKNIRCKNGYIHVLESVLIPPGNMAEYIHDHEETKIFSKLLERFCIPYYDDAITNLYALNHPGFSDSIFARKFIASRSNVTIGSYKGQVIKNYLPYDPGWNSYSSGTLEADMAAMFVPTDAAMDEYFNSGVGRILRERYGTWENIPDETILPFLKRHMRTSIAESVPSKFHKMVDAENYALPVEPGHIVGTYSAVNGQVYLTNAVYPPVDYISVYSPVLLSDNTKVFDWAINISQQSVDGTLFAFYKLYLNSLVSKYALFVPTDEALKEHYYIDPIAYGQTTNGMLKFWYDEKDKAVYATVYAYDKTTGVVGDSIDVIKSNTFIRNRLWDLLDGHIVVGGIETGNQYYVMKGNGLIKVTDSGSLSIQGGGDVFDGTKSVVTNVFEQDNGKTYFLDKYIQPSLRSAYKIMSETPEFSEFFNLLNGVPDTYASQIFEQQGIDYRIKFFSAFRYTIYVPTNQAVQDAIANGTIIPWENINAIADAGERDQAVDNLVRILKYHFQDDALFYGQNYHDEWDTRKSLECQSATLKTSDVETYFGSVKNKYLKLGIEGTSDSFIITMDSKKGDPIRQANVVTTDGLYNIIAKDYVFGKKPSEYRNVDGTGSVTGSLFNTSTITTSASAVIHQIDKVLTFE